MNQRYLCGCFDIRANVYQKARLRAKNKGRSRANGGEEGKKEGGGQFAIDKGGVSVDRYLESGGSNT